MKLTYAFKDVDLIAFAFSFVRYRNLYHDYKTHTCVGIYMFPVIKTFEKVCYLNYRYLYVI